MSDIIPTAFIDAAIEDLQREFPNMLSNEQTARNVAKISIRAYLEAKARQ